MSKIIEQPPSLGRNQYLIYRPNLFVASEDVSQVYAIADFIALVHDTSISTDPARYGGYWLRFKTNVVLRPTSLKVASWLYGAHVSQPYLE